MSGYVHIVFINELTIIYYFLAYSCEYYDYLSNQEDLSTKLLNY